MGRRGLSTTAPDQAFDCRQNPLRRHVALPTSSFASGSRSPYHGPHGADGREWRKQRSGIGRRDVSRRLAHAPVMVQPSATRVRRTPPGTVSQCPPVPRQGWSGTRRACSSPPPWLRVSAVTAASTSDPRLVVRASGVGAAASGTAAVVAPVACAAPALAPPGLPFPAVTAGIACTCPGWIRFGWAPTTSRSAA